MAKGLSILIILLVVFVDYLGLGMVFPLFVSMLKDTSLSFLPDGTSDVVCARYLGVLLAAMPLTQFFASPILGAISDKRGRKSTIIGALSLGIIGYFISVWSIHCQSLTLLLLSRVFIGISAASAAVAQAAIADISTEKEKTKNYGLYNMALGLGFTIGPLFGGMVSKGGGYKLPFLFGGIFVALNILLVAVLFKETVKEKSTRIISAFTGLKNVRKAFGMKGMRVLFLAMFIFAFGWSFFFEFMPIFLIDGLNFDREGLGFFYAYAGGCFAISSGILIRPLIKRIKSETALFVGLFFGSLALLLLSPIESKLWLYIGLFPLMFFVSMVFPTATSTVSRFAPEGAQGETLGVYQSIQTLGFAVSPALSGLIVGYNHKMPIYAGSLILMIAAVVICTGYRVTFKLSPKP